MSLHRKWDVLDANEVTGPYWEIVFRPLSHRDWEQARCGSNSPVSGAARGTNWARQVQISGKPRGESLE
jgi:hypothetical protein